MAGSPSASDFTSFYDLVPSSNHKCIWYKPKQGTTCQCDRPPEDEARACKIYAKIIRAPGPPAISLLEEYVRCNLCHRPFGTFEGHRNIAEPLLIRELATRWRHEIKVEKGSVVIKEEVESGRSIASPAYDERAHVRATRSSRQETSPLATAFDPDVLWFVRFKDIDPFRQAGCIYMTRQGNECPWPCTDEDNEAARDLHDLFSSTRSPPKIGLLMRYALYNCCRSGQHVGAGHQNRIEDAKLLKPLAERWLEEIRRQREQFKTPTQSGKGNKGDEVAYPNRYFSDDPVIKRSSPASPREGSKVAPSDRGSSARARDRGSLTPTPAKARYNLRSGPHARSQDGRFSDAYSPDTLSEFRAHDSDPTETVATKLRQSIESGDPQSGHVYIYHRDSSPGYVKIGYTASSTVEERLEQWSKCGYEPRLVYSTDENKKKVPFPKRVETLVHYELAKEWRAERMCKMSSCKKSHREWFEVSQKRAVKVVRDWVKVMIRVKPYDGDGHVKAWVPHLLDTIVKKESTVTASALLEYHQRLLATGKKIPETLIHHQTELRAAPLSPSTDSPRKQLSMRANDSLYGLEHGAIPESVKFRSETFSTSDRETFYGQAEPRAFVYSEPEKPRRLLAKLFRRNDKAHM
ncbi:GIY-YIG nuclease family protein [Microdochium nivale]|nr:GIY-YIG nuclease family protein [Microdochium nivale]